jgi:CheY-like chemotaxis protein
MDNKITNSNSFKVLLVENDKASSDLIIYLLKNLCSIELAEDGFTAIDLAKENYYPLILMDIGLGFNMNGVETTAAIRKISGYKDTPIVAVTAFAMKGDREYFLSHGLTHYISKPFSVTAFVDLIKGLLPN